MMWKLKLAAGALAIIIAFGAGWYVNGLRWNKKLSAFELAQSRQITANLSAQARRNLHSDEIQHNQAQAMAAALADAKSAAQNTVTAVQQAVAAHPAPNVCVAPDSLRKRLQTAVDEANAAKG